MIQEFAQLFSKANISALRISPRSYVQSRDARHTLALNTWGIAIGLELVETTAADGSLEVFLQPGYAFDGYGQAIVVLSPYKIPTEFLTNAPTGLVEVWVRYQEREKQGVRKGFKVCDAVDAFERIAESFVVEVGPRKNVMDRQSGITLAGEFVQDAREALRQFDDKGPVLCDGSVPHQEFPLEIERPRWLIPVGYVNWQAGVPGAFLTLTDEHQRLSRMFRRQVGQVTENIYAANEVIRLRSRSTRASLTKSNDEVCEEEAIQIKDFDTLAGPTVLHDLVWIEGNLRIEGHGRLFGTKLEFRDEQGEDRDIPLYLRRRSVNGLTPDSQDLELVVGKDTQHTTVS